MNRSDFIRTACARLITTGISERQIAEHKLALAEALWDERMRFGRFAGLTTYQMEFCDLAVLHQPAAQLILDWTARGIKLEAAQRYDLAIEMAQLLAEKCI